MTKVARTFIFCLVLFFSVLTVHAQKIYFTDNGAVRRMNLNGTSLETIVPAGGYDYIAVDGYSGFLFYNDGQDSYRAYLDGSDPMLLTSDGAMAGYNNIEVVPDEELVLFVGIGEIGEVYTGSYFMDPTDPFSTFPASITSPLSEDEFVDVAYNPNDGRVYFTGNDGRIYSCYTNGSGMSSAMGSDAQGAISVDFDEGYLYWVRYMAPNYHIVRSNLDGSGITSVYNNGTNSIESLEVYPEENAIFFTQWNGVFRIARDGSDHETLYTGTSVRTVAIDPDIWSPGFSTLSPSVTSLSVPTNTNLTISFNERVKKSTTTGTADDYSFRIYKASNDELIETLPRSSSNVTVSGYTVTLNLTSDLEYNTTYYVLAGNKTVADLTDNDWTGIGLISTWQFTTDPDETVFYSRQDGDWDDPDTWSHVGHTGPAATGLPGTGTDVVIGPGHTVSLSGYTGVVANSTGLTIETGGVLDANEHGLNVWGNLNIKGTIENPGILSGNFRLYATGSIPVFKEIHYGVTGMGGVSDIYTNVVALNGIQSIDGGVINTNGFEICVPPTPPPTSPVFSNITQTTITLGWTVGSGDAFIVAREGSTSFRPSFGQAYDADPSFGDGDAVGTGNYVVHAGTGNSVTITGLTPATTYEFDLYSFSTSIGGCYSVHNFEFATATACPVLDAPTGAVNAQYCTGDTKPALTVTSPGTGKRIHWYSAATGGSLVAGDDTGGTGLGEVFIPNAPSGTFYAEVYDEATFCTSATRTAVTLTLHPPLVAGTATGDQDICGGEDPVVLDGGTASGGTGAFTYTWESATAAGGPFTAIAGATDVTYDPPAGITQTTYFRRVTRSSTCVQPGNAVVVNVVNQPNITVQPEPTSVCLGDAVSFYVEATGTSLNYQWQVDNGNGFININDGGVYSGSTTNLLDISNSAGLNGFRYRCIISASGSCPVESDAAILLNNSNPIVVNQTQTLCEAAPGSGVAVVDLNTFNNAVVGGSSGYNIEWHSDAALDSPIDNPESTTATDGSIFYARVVSISTECGSVATATINVSSKPNGTGTISGPSELCLDSEGTYVVSGIASATSYQWEVPAGLDVISRNGSTAVIRATAASSGLAISVVGENTCGTGGSATSDVSVRSKATVILSATEEVLVGEPASFSYTVSSGAVQEATWNFGDQNTSDESAPEHTFTSPGTFTVSLTATDAAGCETVETVNVVVLPIAELSDSSIKNVITANGDNSNGFLYIENIESYPSNEVVLLDRWGVEVFRKENYLNDWDARRSNGDFLPAGQYICVVKLTETGKVFSRTVSIIKR